MSFPGSANSIDSIEVEATNPVPEAAVAHDPQLEGLIREIQRADETRKARRTIPHPAPRREPFGYD